MTQLKFKVNLFTLFFFFLGLWLDPWTVPDNFFLFVGRCLDYGWGSTLYKELESRGKFHSLFIALKNFVRIFVFESLWTKDFSVMGLNLPKMSFNSLEVEYKVLSK